MEETKENEREMEEEINAAIKKSLPQQVGSLLQKELSSGRRAIKELKAVRDQFGKEIKKHSETENFRHKAILEVIELKSELDGWKKRESEIISRENRLDVTILKNKVEEIGNSRDEIKELARIAFRNGNSPVTMKDTSSNISKSYTNEAGMFVTDTESRTETETETKAD